MKGSQRSNSTASNEKASAKLGQSTQANWDYVQMNERVCDRMQSQWIPSTFYANALNFPLPSSVTENSTQKESQSQRILIKSLESQKEMRDNYNDQKRTFVRRKSQNDGKQNSTLDLKKQNKKATHDHININLKSFLPFKTIQNDLDSVSKTHFATNNYSAISKRHEKSVSRVAFVLSVFRLLGSE